MSHNRRQWEKEHENLKKKKKEKKIASAKDAKLERKEFEEDNPDLAPDKIKW